MPLTRLRAHVLPNCAAAVPPLASDALHNAQPACVLLLASQIWLSRGIPAPGSTYAR